MSKSTAVAPRSVPFAIVSTVVAGLLVYVFLGIVSRATSDLGFDQFSVFWAVSLLVGFGLFVPVEQEMARAAASGAGAAVVVRGSAPIAAALAVVGALTGGIVAVTIVRDASPALLVCFVLIGPVSALQFLARGLLLARGRVTTYLVVLLGDAVARVILAGIAASAIPDAGAAVFAGALLLAIVLAHGWALLALRGSPIPGGRVAARGTAAAVATLLGAGIVSQLLLNSGPLVIQALGAAVGVVGSFQAAFTVARIPLFILTPMQSLLIPPFVRLLDGGVALEARRFLGRLAAAVVAFAAVAGAVAFALGPWVVEVLFGEDRRLAAPLIATLVVGACLNGGLVVLTQALVAVRRHRFASLTWGGAMVAAIAAFVAVLLTTGDAVAATCLAFAAGSAVGFGIAALELAVIPRRTPS